MCSTWKDFFCSCIWKRETCIILQVIILCTHKRTNWKSCEKRILYEKRNYLKNEKIIYEKEKIIPSCKPHGPQLNMSGPWKNGRHLFLCNLLKASDTKFCYLKCIKSKECKGSAGWQMMKHKMPKVSTGICITKGHFFIMHMYQF